MKTSIHSFVVVFLLFFSGNLISQETRNTFDQVYGPDQKLCNGKKYGYLSPQGTKRDQYLLSPRFSPGRVTLRGKDYEGVSLNYDIYNQQLLLQYHDEGGALYTIEVSQAWLSGFSLGEWNFEFLDPDGTPRFYQVLGDGGVRVLYYWYKTLNLNTAVGSTNYIFSPAVRDSYLIIDGELIRFRKKQSFIRPFEPAVRSEIKSYLRKNKIRVKRASNEKMSDLLSFINGLTRVQPQQKR